MKKIIMYIITLICISSSIVYGAENKVDVTQDDVENVVKQSVLYKAKNNSLYSKWGWSQSDVITQYLRMNNGFKKELGVDSITDAATIDKIEYGHIIGVCQIDFKKLDKYIQENTLQDNIDKVIRITNETYIELKCNGITLAYMNVNEDERISHFVKPGIFNSEYIKSSLPSQAYINPVIYLISENEYIKGVYIRGDMVGNIVTYENFEDSSGEQLVVANTIDALISADEKYIIDFPRVDYELQEQQKLEEIEKLIEEGKQRDTILYGIVGFLTVALIVVVIVFSKIVKKVEEQNKE